MQDANSKISNPEERLIRVLTEMANLMRGTLRPKASSQMTCGGKYEDVLKDFNEKIDEINEILDPDPATQTIKPIDTENVSNKHELLVNYMNVTLETVIQLVEKDRKRLDNKKWQELIGILFDTIDFLTSEIKKEQELIKLGLEVLNAKYEREQDIINLGLDVLNAKNGKNTREQELIDLGLEVLNEKNAREQELIELGLDVLNAKNGKNTREQELIDLGLDVLNEKNAIEQGIIEKQLDLIELGLAVLNSKNEKMKEIENQIENQIDLIELGLEVLIIHNNGIDKDAMNRLYCMNKIKDKGTNKVTSDAVPVGVIQTNPGIEPLCVVKNGENGLIYV